MRYPLDGEVRVNSPYGPRNGGFHYGIDLFAMPGTPAYAVDDGEVFYTAYETAGGNHLAMYLDHPPVPAAPKAGYMHLDRFAVGPGTRVRRGDVVGWTDTTGAVDGPHLHFWTGTNANVGAIDPLPYFDVEPPAPSGHQSTGAAIDYSYARPGPNELIAAGYRDAIGYLGNPRLASDACPGSAYLDVLAAGGVRWTFIYETDPNRPLQGHAAGVDDARFSDQRATDRGYPPNAPFFVCASDGSALSPSSGGEAIADYARGWAATTGRKLAAYGNRYAVDWFNAGVRGVNPDQLIVTGLGRDGGWVPTTWGADPTRDLIGQDPNVRYLDGTDHNVIYADWWPTTTPVPDLGGLIGALRNQREDTMYAWTADNAGPTMPWFESGMLYEFTPYQVTRCPGVAAKDVLGSVQVTGDTMYGLMAARFRTAAALNIPVT